MNNKPVPQKKLYRDNDVVQRLRQSITREHHDVLPAVEGLIHLLKTYGVMYEALSDALAPYDLSLAQYNLLFILYHTPDRRLQMSEIGERMSVTRTNITKLVNCLERSGMVRRSDRPGDRRVVMAELTTKGEELVRCVYPRHLNNVRALWAHMDKEECLQLTHLLLKLRDSARRAIEEGALNRDEIRTEPITAEVA